MKASNPPPGPDDRNIDDPSLVSEMLTRAILEGEEPAEATPVLETAIDEVNGNTGDHSEGEPASTGVLPVAGGDPFETATNPRPRAGSGEGGTVADLSEDPETGDDEQSDDEKGHDEQGDDEQGDDEPSSGLRNAIEWSAVIVGALVVALLIKTFLLQAFYIPSESMEPTLEVGDRVLVNKLSYDFHDVNRGDLVVFHRPETDPSDDEAIKDLIKRVVGLPGETVESIDGHVYIDGQPLEEPYVPDGVTTTMPGPVTVPEGQVFVMGDNRENSSDSRVFGPISQDLIIGRAFLRVWPLSQIGFL